MGKTSVMTMEQLKNQSKDVILTKANMMRLLIKLKI